MPKRVKETTRLDNLHLEEESENVSDLELEDILFEDEDTSSKPKRPNPLPIIGGLGLLGISALYLLQQINIFPGNISEIFFIFPLAGLLLILLIGLSPKLRKRKKRAKKKRKNRVRRSSKSVTSKVSKWQFPPKSRKKYLAGVCGGLARRIDMDPTLFRALFILALIATGGTVPLIGYILFAIFMPSPDDDPNL